MRAPYKREEKGIMYLHGKGRALCGEKGNDARTAKKKEK